MLYITAALIVVIATIEFFLLIKNKQWGELVVVGGLLFISMVYNISLIQDWQLPTIKDGVEVVFAPVTAYLEGLFK